MPTRLSCKSPDQVGRLRAGAAWSDRESDDSLTALIMEASPGKKRGLQAQPPWPAFFRTSH
jgi:hypothetical protein